MSDPRTGVAIPQRTVPVPTSISPAAQAALESLVTGEGVPRNALFQSPAADDPEGWRRLKAAADAHYAAALAQRGDEPRSTVTTMTVGTATIHVAEPETPISPEYVYIDLHGGALIFGGGEACRVGARMRADQHGVRCYAVDYRTPPDHPFPAALDDCIAAYRYVLDRYAPGNVVLAGRSAGGNLAVATLLRAKIEGLQMPAALVLLSPQVDLTESGDSFQVNQLVDVVLPGSLMSGNLLYAGGADLADPMLSPLFGELRGLPPTLLQTGTRDLFLSSTVRMHRALRRAAVEAELHVFEAMPHGGFDGRTPEDRELEAEVSRFVSNRWGCGQRRGHPPAGR